LAPAHIASNLVTTSYAIVASLQTLALFTLWTPSGIIWWQAQGVFFWLLIAFYLAAWTLLGRAIWDAGLALQTGFLGWWAVAKGLTPLFPPMPTTGLFRMIRQPIYLAFALTLWTVPTWTPDQLAVALTLTCYCVGGPLLKEKRFKRRFGEAFAAYSAKVPYFLPQPHEVIQRNNLAIYGSSGDWWNGEKRWHRALRNLVPVRFEFFDPIVGDWTGKQVLDVGCGAGFMAEALYNRGAEVVGVDPSEGAIISARRHSEAANLDIAYFIARGEALPFDSGSFDIVVCVDVLEHVVDLSKVLSEIRRVTRPQGLFLFDTINRNRLASFVMITIGENLIRLLPRGTHEPKLFIRPKDLALQLERLGFVVGPMVGMGPSGITWRLEFSFSLMRTIAIQYLGQARLMLSNK